MWSPGIIISSSSPADSLLRQIKGRNTPMGLCYPPVKPSPPVPPTPSVASPEGCESATLLPFSAFHFPSLDFLFIFFPSSYHWKPHCWFLLLLLLKHPLRHCYSKCDPQCHLGGCEKCRTSDLTRVLQSQTLHFNKIPRWSDAHLSLRSSVAKMPHFPSTHGALWCGCRLATGEPVCSGVALRSADCTWFTFTPAGRGSCSPIFYPF